MNHVGPQKIEINTNQLWYSNKYDYQWIINLNAKSILFGIISIYCFFIILFNATNIVIDIINVRRNTLHQKSKFYASYIHKQN